MIIVTGSVETAPKNLARMLDLSLEHVRRSRDEPGCISHSAQIDAENENRIVFFEQWQDMPSLQQHFEVPASVEFVKQLSKLALQAPALNIFEAQQIR